MREGRLKFRMLSPLFLWPVALAFLGGLLVLAYVFHGVMRDRRGGSETAQGGKRAGNNVVKLGAELAESHGLKAEAAQEVEWQARVAAYGRVVANPRATAEVRAP